ncbi:hypothetical protein HNP84_009891 [Thermocatellispora tengchongensis]|uniref:Thioesterase family protein n=1 Tax=Thermocatellispora tengchongensis TaxID=1073253 RepID=A0A840PMJ7_9ACTN|nr:hypothetical protein [Thermocatellispora tengchongensis]MBB5140126.1 hypothetical protein [Thermocatellispora tengchongensis]
MEARELVVPERYRGPEGMANGGWISGMLASHLPQNGVVEVTLRAPTPLGESLRVTRTDDGGVVLGRDGTVLVEARPGGPEPEAPPFVPLDVAEKAERDFPGTAVHPFPGCFACGEREPGDGLRIHPGPVPAQALGTAPAPGEAAGMVAATWYAHPLLGDWSESLPLTHVWGALDCVGGWAHMQGDGGAALLGRLAARVHRTVFIGQTYVVVARREGRDGRKLYSSSAIYRPDGRLVAAARATWIGVPAGPAE